MTNVYKFLIAFSFMGVVLSACGTPAIPKTGSLELSIQGLSAGLEPDVSVTGPNNFKQNIKTSTTLENLDAGNYSIMAQDIVQTDTYLPDKRQQTVVIKVGETASLILTYTKQAVEAGSLEISVSGLPAGIDADITVTGPENFNQNLKTSSVLNNLKPGDYQVIAESVTLGGDTYFPTPSNQTIGIATGSKTDISVVYSKQAPTVGQLILAISGLPTDLTASLSLRDPNGFSHDPVSLDLSTLKPGTYTLTADSFFPNFAETDLTQVRPANLQDPHSYTPYPKSQELTIIAGEATTARVAYVPKILRGTEGDQFGYAVALDGDFMVIGAPSHETGALIDDGTAYLYQRSSTGEWVFLKELRPAPEKATLKPLGISAGDKFGYAVAISGDTVVVGAPNAITGVICEVKVPCVDIHGGSAYVFKRDEGGNNTFGQTLVLRGLGAIHPIRDGDEFGSAVAINGSTILVGVPGLDFDVNHDGTIACDINHAIFAECDEGGAYLFFSGLSSSGTKLLLTADAKHAASFGTAVAISQDTAVVGATRDSYDVNGDGNIDCGETTTNTECSIGSVYLFARKLGGEDNWGQVKKLAPSESLVDDQYGASVAIGGDTVVVGSRNSDGGQKVALAFIYDRNQGGADNWGEVKKLSIDNVLEGFDAANVAISDDTVVMAVPFFNGDVNEDQVIDCGVGGTGKECFTGAILLFDRNQGGANNFGLLSTFVSSDSANRDTLGWGLAFDGKTMVAGAPGHQTIGAVYVLTP